MARRRRFFRRMRRAAVRVVYRHRAPKAPADRVMGFFERLLRRPVSVGVAGGLAFGAVAAPFVLPAANAPIPDYPTVLEAAEYCIDAGAIRNADGTVNGPRTALSAVRVVTQTYIASLVTNWPTVVGLGAGSALARWGGKRVKL